MCIESSNSPIYSTLQQQQQQMNQSKKQRRQSVVLCSSTSSSTSSSSTNDEELSVVATVSSINLEGLMLDNDHEAEAARMAKSITAWLDAEWMPQEVHVQMASSAQASYIKCRRTNGEHDLMAIMMTIADDLERQWHLYNADAFCNAYDIANYVADYLTHRAGLETCSCSHRIY